MRNILKTFNPRLLTSLLILAGLILVAGAAWQAHARLPCTPDGDCPEIPLPPPPVPAPATVDNLPATYDFSFDTYCSDTDHGGDSTCGNWVQLPPNAINNYQIWSIDIALSQSHIETGLFLESPTMRVDVCTGNVPGGSYINCDVVWDTWMGVPGQGSTWFQPVDEYGQPSGDGYFVSGTPNPSNFNFTPSPYTLADARAVYVRIWVNNADIKAHLDIHARRPHVDSFGFNENKSQICWSATNALNGITVTGPARCGVAICDTNIGSSGGGLSTAETCADTAGPGDYTISAVGPGPGLNGSPPATVQLTQTFNNLTYHYGCGADNTCQLVNGPPPDTDGCSVGTVGQGCVGVRIGGPSHRTCENQACVTVDGEGQDSCQNNADCRPGGGRNKCDGSACVFVPGDTGPDQCQNNNDCNPSGGRNKCENNTCVFVPGETGPDQCSPAGVACGTGRNECKNNACIFVPGDTGPDQCSINSDCQIIGPQNHTVCQSGACVTVSGGGSNQCAVNSDCPQPNPICSYFTANPNRLVVPPPAHSTLSWSCSNVSSCSIDQGVGSVSAEGSAQVSPSETTTYTLTCSGAGGRATIQTETNLLIRVFQFVGGALREINPQ